MKEAVDRYVATVCTRICFSREFKLYAKYEAPHGKISGIGHTSSLNVYTYIAVIFLAHATCATICLLNLRGKAKREICIHVL